MEHNYLTEPSSLKNKSAKITSSTDVCREKTKTKQLEYNKIVQTELVYSHYTPTIRF